MRILSDEEVDLSGLSGRRLAVIGYGNQGHAHALNLRDSGSEVLVGARQGRGSDAAARDGFRVLSPPDAARDADVVMLLLPDEITPKVFEEIRPRLRSGQAIGFGHGFCVHYGTVKIPEGLDVFLAAPVGPGHLLRRRFTEGRGIPVVVAVDQDASGRAWSTARSWAAGLGGGRAGIMEATFREETETDLFGEQAVIVGGVCALMESGWETLVEAGYPPELAYTECIHQMKLLVDLVHEEGMAGMRNKISKTALYGDLTRGPMVVDGHVKERMRIALRQVQDGSFAREWLAEHESGAPRLKDRVRALARHPLERVGARLRRLIQRS
ncbi:MAG: ketol-acid reductoisomerase [Myxococcota bacterium]